MPSRTCPSCDKLVKSLSGLSRHQRKCLTRNALKRSKLLSEVQSDTYWDLNVDSLPKIVRPPLGAPDGAINHDENAYIYDEGHDQDVLSNQGATPTLGRLSTTGSIRIETYEESTGLKAGMPLRRQPAETSDREANLDHLRNESPHYPFDNSTDFALAQWFWSTGCTKNNIEKFFQDERLRPIQKLLSFSNYDDLMTKIRDIPYGIKNDHWVVREVEVDQDAMGLKPLIYKARYRDVTKVIEFLLGHRPFADHLAYAPVRHFNGEGTENRIYTEMHTADWWWKTQGELPEGATIVPVLLATDKTMLTQHHGDESAWPIYLTVGNLDRATRRKQSVPGSILLGFLPVTSENIEDSKAYVYHMIMELILKPLETLAQDGIDIVCADRHVRKCYPIIAGFMADYEEQVLITGIKKAQHCSICLVPPNERENLTKKWDDRTHLGTQKQIQLQRASAMEKTNDSWIHDVENFAWKHHHVNIHKTMMVDILHQLLKGIVMHLITWTKDLISTSIPAARRRKGQRRTIGESSGIAQLDERFRNVPHFTGLKRFNKFSQVKQWTGVEQKAIVRQLIPVIAPLLSSKQPAAIHCARAVVDFVLMAQYKTHDDETLRYMEQALYRIDRMKVAFRTTRPINKETEEGHFNFPKFHIMTHYTSFIRQFGAADNFDTEHSEAGHKYQVKNFYGRTNKREDYEDQICIHNTRRINMLAMEDVLLYDQTRYTTQSTNYIDAQVSMPTRELNLTNIGWVIDLQTRHMLVSQGLNPDIWRTVKELNAHVELNGFSDALANFVLQSRQMLANDVTLTMPPLANNGDNVWVTDFPVALHPSLRCWRRRGNNPSNIEALTPELVRCKPAWQGQSDWRRDYVWVQEHVADNKTALNGKRVGRVQVIVSVIDPMVRNSKGIPVRYTGAFVELLRLRNQGCVHKVHGMVEMEDWHSTQSRNPRNASNCAFFYMSNILRSAHVIPAGRQGVYYINNYVDWDQYNTIYDPCFLANGIRDADKIARQYR